jgi:transposase-like protein
MDTKIEKELSEVKRERALTKLEHDILKKTAASFAKASLHGTR